MNRYIKTATYWWTNTGKKQKPAKSEFLWICTKQRMVLSWFPFESTIAVSGQLMVKYSLDGT